MTPFSRLTECTKTKFCSRNNYWTDISYIALIVISFLIKNYSFMIARNKLWLYGQWYHFLESSSDIATAGLLDPLSLESYRKTLAISLGHQFISKSFAWLGPDFGLSIPYIISIILFTSAVYAISHHFTKSKGFAFILAFIVLNSDILAISHVGACGHVGQTVARDYLALSFFILATYFLLNSKLYLHWLFLFIGFLLHLSHGLLVFTVMLPYIMLVIRDKKYSFFHCCSFIITLIGFYIYLNTGMTAAIPVDKDIYFKWMYIFNGGHIFWDHSIDYWQPTIAYFSLLVAGASVIISRYEQHRSFLLSIIASWGIVAIICSVFIYIYPIAIIYRLTPLRSSLFISVLFLIIILYYLVETLKEKKGVLTITCMIALIAVITSRFEGILLSFSIVCILSVANTKFKRRSILIVLAFISVSLLCIYAYYYTDGYILVKHLLSFKGYMFTIVAILIMAAIISVLRFGRKILNFEVPQVIVMGFYVLILLSAFIIPSKYLSTVDIITRERLIDYSHAGMRIKNNSSEKDSILTAPLIYVPMLEVVAERGSVFQIPKAAFGYMAPDTIKPMMQALQNYGIDFKSYKGDWITFCRDVDEYWIKSVDTTKLKEINKKYNSPLVLTYADHKLSLPTLYKGKYYTVYQTH